MPSDALSASDALHHREAAAPGSDEPQEEALRDGAMEGVLVAAGELGYRETSVRAILEYSGWHRVQFYRHFESKEDCFAQAYAVWMDRLGLSLLEAAVAVPGWRARVRTALETLFEFATEQPAIARALLVEVHIAGQPALARHEAVMERLAIALDSVRADLDPDEAPPESTGTFVIAGVESSVREILAAGDPERLWDALPELMHFVVGSYLGSEAAGEAFEEASLLVARRAQPGGEPG